LLRVIVAVTGDIAARFLDDALEDVIVCFGVARRIRGLETESVAKLAQEHGVICPLLPPVAALPSSDKRLDCGPPRAVDLALSRPHRCTIRASMPDGNRNDGTSEPLQRSDAVLARYVRDCEMFVGNAAGALL